MPNLSIITINFNNLQGLQKTMQSVFEQTYTDFEYIVIDGGSTDGSKEWIETHRNKLAYCISEKDNGIYHAMNKGIQQAGGEYLLFLNSGDYLLDNKVLENLVKDGVNKDIIYGNIIWETNNEYRDGIFPSYLSWRYFREQSLPHQASLIKKTLFENYGLYDESLKIVSDWKHFILAIFKYNCTYQHVDLKVAMCNRNGISCDPKYQSLIKHERESVIKNFFINIDTDFSFNEEKLQSLESQLSIFQRYKRTFLFRVYRKCFNFFKSK
ncbi:MAG: glycosyltransferase [Bacteroidetes bacterium]|nr:glycosyltransferase [Bacteroidota bacterium]